MLALKIILGIIGGLLALFILFALFTMLASRFIDTSREYDKNSRFYRFLLDFWTGFMVVVMRIKIDKKGLEKIPKGRFVIVSNHRSNFDPILTWYLLKKNKLAYLTKDDNFRVPWFGRIIRKCCFMGIDRENPRRALETVEKAADLLIRDEVSIGVYPEGTRNKTEETLLPFHNGMFKISKKANVPLVIACIKGTSTIHSDFPKRSPKVEFEVLDVMMPDELKGMKDCEIGAKVRDMLLAALS